MEEHGKSRHTIWLPDETWNRVKLLYKEDNCFSQSEFVEKAIRFYDGYLHTAKSSDFLPKVLLSGTMPRSSIISLCSKRTHSSA